MRLTDLLGAFRRRLVILVIGLLLTAGAVYATVDRVEPTYTSQASLVLLPPRSAVSGGANPYLSLAGLSQALDVLTVALNTRVGEEIPKDNDLQVDLGPDLSGSAFNRNTDGPILQISVRTGTSQSSLDSLQDVIGLVAPTLEKIQTDLRVPTNTQVYSLLIAEDAEPTVSQQPRIRAAFVVFIGFFLLTCLLVLVVDRALMRRKTARSAPPSASGTGSAASTATSTTTPAGQAASKSQG